MNLINLKYLIFILIIINLTSCTKKSNWGSQIDWIGLDLNTLPGLDQYPEYGAVILHDEAKIETFGEDSDGWTMYSRHRIVKIFDIRGHQYANMAIPYAPGNEIEDLQARAISPKGKITVVKPENIYDISLYPNFMLYSDQRSKLFTFPAIEDGSVIEYKYNIRYKGHNYGNSWSFQDNIPVLYSRFEIDIPGDAEPIYKLTGIEIEPFIKKAPKGFKAKYVWEASDMPPIEPEIGMPVRKNAIARLKISSNNTKSWQEVGDWYRNLSKPRMTVSEEMKNLINKITHNKIEDIKKLEAIYNWVNENVRYISVSIGIGSFQPHAASEILQNRYGDCKDMTNLLCTMAKEANIDVFPAIISTWQNGQVDTSIISVSHFNHVIAYCPSLGEEGIWMDATDRACEFNSIPWYDQGRLILAVLEDSAKFILTPKINPLSNRIKTDWHVNLKSDGSAIIAGEDRIWGAQANDLRFELLMQSDKDRKEWIERTINGKCEFSILDSLSISGEYPIRDPLIIKYYFKTERFAGKVEQDLFFCPGNFSSMHMSDLFTEKERKYPIQFKYGMQKQVHLTIELPQNIYMKTANEDISISNDHGDASWQWYLRDEKLFIKNVFILKGDDIRPNEYSEFKSFLKEVEFQDLKQVVLAER